MNKFYVTKEIAEKLRAKGYNVEELHYENSSLSIDEVYQTDNLRIYKFPRIDEVLAWLREEKCISVEPYASASGWRVTICRAYHQDRCDAGGGTCLKEEVIGYNDGGAFEKYEEAALAGIKYCLDNLI